MRRRMRGKKFIHGVYRLYLDTMVDFLDKYAENVEKESTLKEYDELLGV